MNKKSFIAVIIVILFFGAIGIYLTFFKSNTNRFDSKVKAYKIDPNLVEGDRFDEDSSDAYYPIYYFKVNGKEYKCESSSGSSFKPNVKKNMVYYNSDNPKDCLNEIEKNSSKFVGILFLAIAIIVPILHIKSKDLNNSNSNNEEVNNAVRNDEVNGKINKNVGKAVEVYEKIQLIISRIILGGFIIFLFVFILIDIGIVVQTIKSKDYIETTATYVETIENKDNSEFNECKYTFLDKKEQTQEIKISFCDEPRDKVKIKYNKSDPQDFYEENSIMSKSGWIWFYGKLILFALLIGIFCDINLLKRTSISISKN